jgi:predicted membrane-bound spermidine synthase
VTTSAWVSLLFFWSGVAALVYQICWQRILFASFGIDIESVTIIVSTFMLGLGCGAIVGGLLADRWPRRVLFLFAGSEAGIGIFGLFSVPLIRALGDALVNSSTAVLATVNFLVLLIPTSMMGATLPMLVAHAARRNANVGVSIGGLYFANTLGAAVGCYMIGFVWLVHYDLSSAVNGAAIINLAVAVVMAAMAWRLK